MFLPNTLQHLNGLFQITKTFPEYAEIMHVCERTTKKKFLMGFFIFFTEAVQVQIQKLKKKGKIGPGAVA